MVHYRGYLDIAQTITTFPTERAVERYHPVTGEPTGEYGTVTICYHGDERDALARALAALPYGREDIWVKFASWDGPEFFALTGARTFGFFNAYAPHDETYALTAQICELSGGLRDEDDVYHESILALLEEYYGPGMCIAYSYA